MDDLRHAAISVLAGNQADGYVAPARGLYAHQHLWDTCFTAIGQRHYDLPGAMAGLRRLLAAQCCIRKRRCDSEAILARPRFAIEDLTYNSILIWANELLRQISDSIGAQLPGGLTDSMRKNEEAMETLWDVADECYYPRDVRSGRLRRRTLELVRGSGFSEYYQAFTGEPAGVRNFSWTAALTLDMLAQAG